jgi:hypothetical protein
MVKFDGYGENGPSKKELTAINNFLSDPGNMLSRAPKEMVSFDIPSNITYVDNWVPQPQDLLFTHTDKAIILPVSAYYG